MTALNNYYADVDTQELVQPFIHDQMHILYPFAAIKYAQHGPGAVFVLGKLHMRELLSPEPPAPFDGSEGGQMDRFLMLLWVVDTKTNKAGAKKGRKGARGGGQQALEYASLSEDVRQRTQTLSGLITQCSLTAVPIVFIANPSGDSLETHFRGTILGDLLRAPKFKDRELERDYTKPGRIFLTFAKAYAVCKEHGEMYSCLDMTGINLDRHCDDPNTT